MVSSVLAGPALTANYLNQYITPIQYQNMVGKLSLGSAGIIFGIAALGLARQGVKATYDRFMYDKDQQAIEQEIEKIKKNIEKIDTLINNTREKDSAVFDDSALSYEEEKLYQNFVDFYNKENEIIDRNRLKMFLALQQHSSTANLLNICQKKKIELIFNLASKKDYFPSQGKFSLSLSLPGGNPGLAIAGAILLAPWYLIFAAMGRMGSTSQNTQEDKLKEVDNLTIIIKKLSDLT